MRTVIRGKDARASGTAVVSLRQIIEDESRRNNLDPLLLYAMIEVESGYDPYTISPKGARGLMQLIPSTAKRFGVNDSFSLSENVRGGARYLRYLLDLFQDERLALAAYNAGEEAVVRCRDIPPYPETRNYLRLVQSKYKAAKRMWRRTESTSVGEAMEDYRPVERFVDPEGRLHLRTP